MNKQTKIAACLALTLSSVAFSSVVAAATATAQFPVTALVVDSCVVGASPLAFGEYNGISGGVSDSVGVITPLCTSGTYYAVSLSAGLGSGATQSNRLLTGPNGTTLNYGIYTDPSRLTSWGDGTGGTSQPQGEGAGSAQPILMYGRISTGQHASVGAYSDTITVTISF